MNEITLKGEGMQKNVANTSAHLLVGKDLPRLVRILKSTDAHISAMLGLTIGRWYILSADGTRKKRNSASQDVTKQKGNEPLIPRHAIMTRFLLENPKYGNPPTFNDLLDELKELDPEMNHRKLAIILGLEPTAGDRIMQSTGRVMAASTKLSPTATNMIILIYNNLKYSKSREQKIELLQRLVDNVNNEAEARGIAFGRIWEKGGWNKYATNPALNGTDESD